MDNGIVKVANATQQMPSFFANNESFELGMKMANVFAGSDFVPDTYKKKPGNCLIAINLANRIGADPLMVMQNLVIIYGRPSWSSTFLIACINASGKCSPLRYEFWGQQGQDNWSCRAYAIDKDGEILKGTWVSIALAKQEGWYQKNGSKWKTMPEQMLRYRAAAWFQRAYFPELSLGIRTQEEIEDADAVEITDLPTDAEKLQAELEKAQQQETAEANSQSLDMNNGESKEETKPADKAPSEEKKDPQKGENTAQTKSKVQPMGKQKVPDMFNQQ